MLSARLGREVPVPVRGPVRWNGDPWHADALCQDYLGLNWVPGKPTPCYAEREVCVRCPVRYECTEQALRFGERGVWGGLTEQERAELGQGAAA